MARFSFKIDNELFRSLVVRYDAAETPAAVHAICAVVHLFKFLALVAQFGIFSYKAIY